LGFQEDGTALDVGAGFVGQEQAREAADLVVDMIRQKKMAGHALLLAGPLGIWKTAAGCSARARFACETRKA
jgi:RuvB-like protein 1 (pontin 52)